MKKPCLFRLELRQLIEDSAKKLQDHSGKIAIRLPSATVSIQPTALEQRVAREIVIWMADRRVLNAKECCDDCIRRALESLQKIRERLVSKQVDLAQATEGALFLFIEMQLEAIRQFLTFEEQLNPNSDRTPDFAPGFSDLLRPHDRREPYFDALEKLRAHLHRCLIQISKIADVAIPRIEGHMRYDEAWDLTMYNKPTAIPREGGVS